MEPPRARIVFSDMDDTFLAPDKSIPPQNLDAVDAIRRAGVLFVPCTGRHLGGVPGEALARADYVVCDSGASVYDARTREVVWSRPLAAETAIALYELVGDVPIEFDVYAGGNVYARRSDMWITDEADLEPPVKEYLASSRIPFDGPFDEFVRGLERIDRLSLQSVTRDPVDRMLPALRGIPGAVLTPVLGNVVEVTSPAASKGSALEALCSLAGIPVELSVAFGDSPNDIAMLEAAGTSVAVENAIDECKRLADLVAPACHEGGFARGLELLGIL